MPAGRSHGVRCCYAKGAEALSASLPLRPQSVTKEVVENLCAADGRSCQLNAGHPSLGAGPGDVLRIEYTCMW